ncbi:MAG: radical SAM protein [bacterium]|nr:radical SAM protein [bacterium]
MEIVSQKSKYKLIERLGILVNSEVEKDYLKIDNDRPKINEKDIISALETVPDNGVVIGNLAEVKSMALSLVEECNFRCEYCVYSGSYENERVHQEKTMDAETAGKAIDFFLNFIDNPLRSRKDNNIFIGFYGGEPLLRFDLIKKMIERAEKLSRKKNLSKKFHIGFRLTTNGYLLHGEIVDYLKEKNVTLDISLDGPSSEHDKFRKGKNGENTWATVMANIEALYNKYPECYDKKVNFLATIHPLHDTQRIEDFFKSNDRLFGKDRIRATPVNLNNLRPSVKAKVDKKLKAHPKQSLNELLYSTLINESIHEKYKLKNLDRQKKFTGGCFPGGERILVDTEGNFHMCERVPDCFPIGNVDTGFDFEKIRRLLEKYNNEVIRCRCWECDVWFLCDICFAHTVGPNKEIKIQCSDKKKEYKK